MADKKDKPAQFCVYFSKELYDQFSRLQNAGLSASAIARHAIRKCTDASILPDTDASPFPVRANLYISTDDAAALAKIAHTNNCSKAHALRSAITLYLTTNATAIDSLF